MFDFLKRLFKKEKIETSDHENGKRTDLNRSNQLNSLWEKFKEGKFEEVISQANNIIERNDPKNHNEAFKLLGLSYFRLGRFDLSEQTFIKLTENSTNPDDWFNLVTSATLNKNIELSEKAYLKTIELYRKKGTKENLPLPHIYYYYMQGLRDVKEYPKAYKQLEKLKEIYSKLVITDSTFLYLRGVPFLNHTMEASKEILENIDKDLAKTFINDLSKNLDEDGKQYIKDFEKKINYSN